MGWLKEAAAEWTDVAFKLGPVSRGRAASKGDEYNQVPTKACFLNCALIAELLD
jgi:hypothetical protein